MAVIASAISVTLAIDMVTNGFLAFIIAIVFTGIFLSVILDAGFKQSIVISLFACILQFGALLAIAALGVGVSAVST
jgi:hypothetical protein